MAKNLNRCLISVSGIEELIDGVPICTIATARHNFAGVLLSEFHDSELSLRAWVPSVPAKLQREEYENEDRGCKDTPQSSLHH